MMTILQVRLGLILANISIGGAVFAQQQSGGGDFTMNQGWVILITTIIGFIITIYRENRNRKWDLHDRAQARLDLEKKVEKAKEDLESRTEQVQQDLAAKADTRQREIEQKIDENTQISVKAFEATNHVDERIRALTRLFTSVDSEDGRLSQVKASQAETHAIVEDAKETLDRVDEKTTEVVQRLREKDADG